MACGEVAVIHPFQENARVRIRGRADGIRPREVCDRLVRIERSALKRRGQECRGPLPRAHLRHAARIGDRDERGQLRDRLHQSQVRPLGDHHRLQRLGLDYEAFTRSVVLPQGQFDAFLKSESALYARVVKEAFYIAQTGRPGPVLVDVRVTQEENVYPMIPGGAAHNEIKLSPEDDDGHEAISEEGMVLV